MSAKATRSTGNTIHHSLLSDLADALSFVPDGVSGFCCFVVCPLELSVAMGGVSVGVLTEVGAPVLWCGPGTAGYPLVGALVTFGAVVCLTTIVGVVVANLGASVFAAVVTGAGAAVVVFTATKGLTVC